jgi:hypothetical protein
MRPSSTQVTRTPAAAVDASHRCFSSNASLADDPATGITESGAWERRFFIFVDVTRRLPMLDYDGASEYVTLTLLIVFVVQTKTWFITSKTKFPPY